MLGTMADPDLQIRGGGGGGRPVIQTLRKGGAQSQKKIFPALRASFRSKIRQGGPLGPSPGAATREKGRECLL